MTPVFCCGFECGVLGSHFSTSVGSPSIGTSVKRNGDRALLCNPTGANSTVVTNMTNPSGIMVIRLYVYFTTLPNSRIALIAGGVAATGAYFNSSDGKIYASSNGVDGATGVSVTTGQWYRLDVRINKSNNPWLIDVQVDGTACGQASRVADPESFTSLLIGAGGSTTCNMSMDDVIVSQTSADYPIGAGYINHFVPTSDGTHNIAGANDYERTLTGTDILNSTTDAYLLINDIPLESTPGDFISMVAPTANSYVLCKFGPAPGISTPTVAPRAVEMISATHEAGTGNSTYTVNIESGGSNSVHYWHNFAVGQTSIRFNRSHWSDPPGSATSWTIGGGGNGDFNSVGVMFGATSTVDANPDNYLDSVMIEAEFSGDPPVPTTSIKDIISQGIIPFAR